MLKIKIGNQIKLQPPPDFTQSINQDEMKEPIVDFLAKETTLSKPLVNDLISIEKTTNGNKSTYSIAISNKAIPIEYFEITAIGATSTQLALSLPKYAKIINRGISNQQTFINRKAGEIGNFYSLYQQQHPTAQIKSPDFIRGRVYKQYAYPILKLWGPSLSNLALTIGIDVLEHLAFEYLKTKIDEELKTYMKKP